MRSIIRRMALCFITGVVITTAPVHDTFADEPATLQTAPDAAPTEPSTPAPAPEGSNPPAEAGDIQERGLGLVAPGVQPSGTLSLGDRYHAPTPSLNAVANAIRVASKSLSVNLRIPPNLPVTVPVEIHITYITPFESMHRTKTYDPATGQSFHYDGVEGDGKPRTMRFEIFMRELVPNGATFSFSNQRELIPLYNVFISPLRFYMRNSCDLAGKSDITFKWKTPEDFLRTIEFKIGFNETRHIVEFGSSYQEISTQANLTEPVMNFFERDPRPKYSGDLIQSRTYLLPGSTKVYKFYLNDGDGQGPPGVLRDSSNNCQAEITYQITREIPRWNP